MDRHITHGSLFSGIGGAELAAKWNGVKNLFHCDINGFGRSVLDYWYPESESYGDITTTDFSKWEGRIDILSGGFHCQPFSTAGLRKGAGDDCYLVSVNDEFVKELSFKHKPMALIDAIAPGLDCKKIED